MVCIDLPREIYDCINDRRSILYMVAVRCVEGVSVEKVYSDCIAEIKKYVPNFKSFDTYASFIRSNGTYGGDTNYAKSYLNIDFSRVGNYKKGVISVPKHVLDGIDGGFDDLLMMHYKTKHTRKAAYDSAVLELQQYFPFYKPYKNYLSYKSSVTYAHKVKKTTKRKRG